MHRRRTADHSVRRRHLDRGQHHPGARRSDDRSLADGAHRSGERRGLGLHGRGWGPARATQRPPAGPWTVLPHRSRGQRHHWRNGGDPGLRHQRRALWHHARGGPIPAGGHARGEGYPHCPPGAQVGGGLRPHPADDRIGRNARHHHRGDAPAARSPRSPFPPPPAAFKASRGRSTRSSRRSSSACRWRASRSLDDVQMRCGQPVVETGLSGAHHTLSRVFTGRPVR